MTQGSMPAELPEMLRQHLQSAVAEMEREIRDQVPEYAGDDGGEYAERVERTAQATPFLRSSSIPSTTRTRTRAS